MVRINKRIVGVSGFTLIEVLVTLVIIGIVLAMLLPAFTAVQKAALEVKQKAQFSNIEMGLESFRSDFGDYPESGAPINDNDSLETDYCGAQRLAEALVGRDGFGVHKDTQFRIDGLGAGDVVLYDITAVGNKAARRGPYLELESANAVRPQAIFDSSLISANDQASLVLADVYGLMKNRIAGGKTGMPVLYYKADTSNVGHEEPEPKGMNFDYKYTINIYSVTMNMKVFYKWGTGHPLATSAGFEDFYKVTSNPNFVGTTPRPYRSESFILQSAGPDGLYGTGDDVFNFESGK